MNRNVLIAIVVAAVVVVSALAYLTLPEGEDKELLLATTTSTYDSGLLDYIIPDFEEKYGADVKITAVGTGQALTLGKNGDVDVLLVHAPAQEIQFVNDGYGHDRKLVMYNQFVIVGPASDPAGILNTTDVSQALQSIVQTRSVFCSRGDDSGTHSKEKSLWEAAGYDYDDISSQANATWYLSLGQGMGDTLRTASEKGGYALTDEGTFFAMMDDLDLVTAVKGDQTLFNQYGVLQLNSTMHENVNAELAADFSDWITSPEVQDMIGSYTKNGMVLFTPNAEE